MDDSCETEDIYPLGSDPTSPEPSIEPAESLPAGACFICNGLRYTVTPEEVRKWSSLPPGPKFGAFYGVDLSRPEAAARMVVHPQTGQPELYFASDNWMPPGHLPAWQWLQGAMAGCDSCGLVVSAMNHVSPAFWADVSPRTDYKRMWARAVPGLCVMATMTDLRQRFLRLRHQVFEISSLSCRFLSGLQHCEVPGTCR